MKKESGRLTSPAKILRKLGGNKKEVKKWKKKRKCFGFLPERNLEKEKCKIDEYRLMMQSAT